MTNALRHIALTLAFAGLMASSATYAAEVSHKYSREQIEDFIDSLAVDKVGCSASVIDDVHTLLADWESSAELYYTEDGKAINKKWRAFRAHCRDKFNSIHTGMVESYQYRFYKPRRTK